ncbi:hypothetical protein BDN70DRAFT_820400, partial [Pholiota conissans]
TTMVNPGSFKGSRKTFLLAQADLYAEAVVNNNVADTVSDIQRRYFKRYPITLPHDEEPDEAWLAQVDDTAPDADLEPPILDGLNAEDMVAARDAYDGQLKLIQLRKEQITRRLKYQHTKAQDSSTGFEGGIDNPMAVLMSKLTGIDLKKPRKKTGYNDSNITGRKKIGVRNKIYKEAYDELDDDEKAECEARSQAEYDDAMAKLEAVLNGNASTKPEDRQRVIEGLPKFVQPIIDLVAEHTGWKVTVIAGGPEPADNGRLNMISIHSGLCTGTIPMNFGRAERTSYKQFVVPVFANFLKKCYTVEECRAASLPVQQKSLADLLSADVSDWEIHAMDDYIRPTGLASMTPRLATPLPSHPTSPEQTHSLPDQTPSPSEQPSFVQADQPADQSLVLSSTPPSTSASVSAASLLSSKRRREGSLAEEQDMRRHLRTRLSTMQRELAADAEDGVQRTSVASVSNPNHAESTTKLGPSAAHTPSSSIKVSPAPANSPDWFKKAIDFLNSEELGAEWVHLVELWSQFEEQSSYTENGLLGNRGRPTCIAEWIRYARSPSYRPKRSGVLSRCDGTLDDIRMPGKNGLLSVLAALFFWGVSAEGEEGSGGEASWKVAVDDVAWVMKGLVA